MLTDLAGAGPVQQPDVLRPGKKRWDCQRPQRLAGKGRHQLGDIATHLPDEVI